MFAINVGSFIYPLKIGRSASVCANQRSKPMQTIVDLSEYAYRLSYYLYF